MNDLLPPELAGYRILRRLGSGSRAEVLLGHGAGGEVAVKMFHAGLVVEDMEAEAAALDAVDHPHVVALLDLGRDDAGNPVLVLERLGGVSLAMIMAAREGVAPGEAVTALAPVASALAAIHASGRVHGALSMRRVLLRDGGAPVVTGLGHTRASANEADPARRQDLVAFGDLLRSVLERVGTPAAQHLAATTDGWITAPSAARELAAVEERLFALAAAQPLRGVGGSDRPVALRTVARGEPVSEPEPSATIQSPPRLIDRLASIGRLTFVQRLAFVQRLGAAVDPLWSRVPQRFRRPVWLAVAAGGLVLLVLLAAVPPSAPAGAGEGVGAEPVPSVTPSPGEAGPVGGDDPVAALPILLEERLECIRQLSVLCLETVDESGSSAFVDDVALIRDIEAGEVSGAVDATGVEGVELVERHGDVALVSYRAGPDGEPASTLMMRTEAGWRLRAVLPGA